MTGIAAGAADGEVGGVAGAVRGRVGRRVGVPADEDKIVLKQHWRTLKRCGFFFAPLLFK